MIKQFLFSGDEEIYARGKLNGIDDSESTGNPMLFIYLVDYGYTLPYKLDSETFFDKLDEQYCNEKHYGVTVKIGNKWSKEN